MRAPLTTAALVLALTLPAIAPALLHPTTWAVGGGGGDAPSLIWTLWRAARAPLALEHPDVLFPSGATVLLADIPEALAVAPITRLLGPVVAFNALQIAHIALAAALAHALAAAEGLAPRHARIAGVAYGLAPVWLSAVHNGNPDVGPGWLLPACVLLARDVTRGWERVLAAGLILGVAPWCNPYVAVMAALAVLLHLPPPRDTAGALRLLGLGLVAAIPTGAFAWAIEASMAAPDGIITKRGPQDLLIGQAWLAGFAWPQFEHLQDGWTVHAWYLGLAPLALALLARRPRWFGALLLGGLLALGSDLRLTQAGAALAPLPGRLTAQLPGLDALRLVYRFGGLAALAVAMLAAHGAARLEVHLELHQRELHQLVGRWLAPALAVVVAGDLLIVGAGLTRLRAGPIFTDDACALLKDLPPGPVVDLPSGYGERWLLGQTCHGRPVAQALNRPWDRSVRHAMDKAPATTLRRLKKLGFKWVVIHTVPDAAPHERAPAAALAQTLRERGWVVAESAGVVIGQAR